jgi:hypothetical protein
MGRPVRVTVNMDAEEASALKKMAEERNTTVADIVRHAVSVESFLQEQVAKEDAKILVESPSGTTRVFFPKLSTLGRSRQVEDDGT